MKTKNCETYFNIIDQIKEYFEKHLDEFTRMVKIADNYNGCLYGDTLFSMDLLNDELYGYSSEEILQLAFNGYEFAPYALMSKNSFTPCAFNPNSEYFYFNGYGNLVSVRECLVSEYYSKFIDRDHVEAIFEVWENDTFCSFDDDDELDRLFEALSEFED